MWERCWRRLILSSLFSLSVSGAETHVNEKYFAPDVCGLTHLTLQNAISYAGLPARNSAWVGRAVIHQRSRSCYPKIAKDRCTEWDYEKLTAPFEGKAMGVIDGGLLNNWAGHGWVQFKGNRPWIGAKGKKWGQSTARGIEKEFCAEIELQGEATLTPKTGTLTGCGTSRGAGVQVATQSVNTLNFDRLSVTADCFQLRHLQTESHQQNGNDVLLEVETVLYGTMDRNYDINTREDGGR